MLLVGNIKIVTSHNNTWFNLGLSLKNVQREADAIGAFRNARQLYQAIGLDNDVQDCDSQITSLSSPVSPPLQLTRWERVKRWLRNLWRWFAGWWRR